MASIEQKVENLIKEKIENQGYELYDVEYAKEGKNFFLRIYIDSPKGINLSDCEKINNVITDILDTADYIKEQYFLEVSSTGIEKTLKKDSHLKRHIGDEIHIKLFKKDENGKKEYNGILSSYNLENIIIDEKIEIERKNIAQIKTVYNW